MGLVAWNFSWVSRAGKMGWESCAKGHECFIPELLLAFQALFLVIENCSKNYSPHLTANAYRASASCEHCQSLPQSSTSSSFPPANSHLTREGGQLQYLDLAGPSGYVTSYCCSPKIAVHFTFGVLCQSDSGILLRAFTQGGPGSTLLSQWLLFPFSFTLTVPAPELPGCCLRCRDKRSLTAAGAMRLVLDGDWVCTVLPAMLFNRGQCSAAHKRL